MFSLAHVCSERSYDAMNPWKTTMVWPRFNKARDLIWGGWWLWTCRRWARRPLKAPPGPRTLFNPRHGLLKSCLLLINKQKHKQRFPVPLGVKCCTHSITALSSLKNQDSDHDWEFTMDSFKNSILLQISQWVHWIFSSVSWNKCSLGEG